MTDFQDNSTTQHDDFVSQAAQDTKAKARSWWSNAGIGGQLIVVGCGLATLGIAASIGFGAIRGAFEGNPYELTAKELEIVNTEASSFFQKQSETLPNGTVLTGRLLSCNRTDSDRDKRFGCTGQVPVSSVVKDKDGNPQTTRTLGNAKINCDKPRGSVTGCSFK